MNKTNEEIFNKKAKENMVDWNMKAFQITHPRLFSTIILSLEEKDIEHKKAMRKLIEEGQCCAPRACIGICKQREFEQLKKL